MKRGILVASVVSTACVGTGCLSHGNAEPRSDRDDVTAVTVEYQSPRKGLLDAPRDQPEELGGVKWIRNLAEGKTIASRTGRPIFLLFTEVPGCSTVKGFANGPLRHPLIIEAIEDEFVPVAIYNNTAGGHDREILTAYDEPSWNNPVVRFVDAHGKDITKRYGADWTEETLVPSMVTALKAAGRDVPGYLEVLASEKSGALRTTTFSMYCFWTGEVKLSGIGGVVATRPGFAGGREVVDVTWDPGVTNLRTLARQAKQSDGASGIIARTVDERAAGKAAGLDVATGKATTFSAKDDKYQIRRSRWASVPMTPGQATQMNRAAVTPGAVITDVLSPRQLALADADDRSAGVATGRDDFRRIAGP